MDLPVLKRYGYVVAAGLIGMMLSPSCKRVDGTSIESESERFAGNLSQGGNSSGRAHDDTLYSGRPAKSSMDLYVIQQGLKDVYEVDPSLARDITLRKPENELTVKIDIDENENLTGVYLQPETADMLKRANEILKKKYPSYRLCPVAGVRPRSIQIKLYNAATPEQRYYLASPGKGSMHNYGAAIDLTIVDMLTGKEIDMGAALGSLGAISNMRYEEELLKKGILSPEHIANRRVLRTTMREAGFHSIAREWWHYTSASKEEIREKYKIIE